MSDLPPSSHSSQFGSPSGTPANDDHALAVLVTRHLDRSLDELDQATRTRLRAARAEALEACSMARSLSWSRARSVSLTSALVMAMIAALWFWSPPSRTDALLLEDIELLASAESLEFYEDLEFYHWLAVEDHAG